MILVFDTYYHEKTAKTVALSFKDWEDETDYDVYSEILSGVNEYISGEFYKRELPCILSLISKIDRSQVELIIIDGFVYLDDENKFGLGAYLYEALNKKIPVIGVAKTNFATNVNNKQPIYRGRSKHPLYITSIGIDLDWASEKIKKMKGDFRIPDLLKLVDRLSREE